MWLGPGTGYSLGRAERRFAFPKGVSVLTDRANARVVHAPGGQIAA